MPNIGPTIVSSSSRFEFAYSLAGHLSNELAQRLAKLPVTAAAVADENYSAENRWCQLRDTVKSTALAVLGRTTSGLVRRQQRRHQQPPRRE
ncbi:hypothetical protein SprV_0501912900 [Sparganum proliferum]